MRNISWAFLRRRPRRAAFTASGIILGVAFLFATQVANGGINDIQQRQLTSAFGDADVLLQPVGAAGATLPTSRLGQLTALPDVEKVGIRLGAAAALADGSTLSVTGVDATYAQTVPFPVSSGRMPAEGALEVVQTVGHGPAVGTAFTARTTTGDYSLLKVGELKDTGPGEVQGGNVAYTSLSTARRLAGQADTFGAAVVVLANGTDATAWVDKHDFAIPGAQMSELKPFGGGGWTLIFRSFAVIALFVSAFLIYLTTSTAVVERTSVYGTMRAMGASRKQVKRAVRSEAALLGAAGSAVGVVLGFGLGRLLLQAVRSQAGGNLPSVSPTIRIGSVILAFLLGIGIPVLAATIPARRASKIEPVVAMRGDIEGAARLSRAWIAGAVLVFLATAMSAGGGGGSVNPLTFLLLPTGIVLVMPALLSPIARIIRPVVQRISPLAGQVSMQHLVKERARSAYTVGLITVVVTVALTIAMVTSTTQRGARDLVKTRAFSDLTVTSPNLIPPQVLNDITATPGVAKATPIRFGGTRVIKDGTDNGIGLRVIDPATYFDVSGYDWVKGDDDAARAAFENGGGIVMPRNVADALGYDVGDQVTLRTSDGDRPFQLVGLSNQFRQWALDVGTKDGTALFGAAAPLQVAVAVADGADASGVAAALRTKLHAGDRMFSNGRFNVVTRDQIADQGAANFAFVFNIMQVMLYFILVIGLLGLANTMVVAVLQRTREIGVLRSLGTSAREVRRMFTTEALVLVAVAFVLAIPFSLLMRLPISATLTAQGVKGPFVFPVAGFITTAVIVGLAGWITSWAPARRAAGLVITDTMRDE